MPVLIASAVFFLGIHLLVAGTAARTVIVGAIGERPWMGLFSLASLAGIVALIMSYNATVAEGWPPLWDLGEGVKHAGGLVIAIAFLLAVPGILTANPTSVGMEALATKAETATGMLRITRHPFLWGVAIWSAFHLAANGDAPSIVLFGTFFLLSVLGTFSIDAKRSRKMGPDWSAFSARTSNIPFQAIISGRSRLVLGELLTFRQAIAVVLFAIIMLSHHWLFGVSPFPGGWVPF